MKVPLKVAALLLLPLYFSLNWQSLDEFEGNEGGSTTFGGIIFGGSSAGSVKDSTESP